MEKVNVVNSFFGDFNNLLSYDKEEDGKYLYRDSYDLDGILYSYVKCGATKYEYLRAVYNVKENLEYFRDNNADVYLIGVETSKIDGEDNFEVIMMLETDDENDSISVRFRNIVTAEDLYNLVHKHKDNLGRIIESINTDNGMTDEEADDIVRDIIESLEEIVLTKENIEKTYLVQ